MIGSEVNRCCQRDMERLFTLSGPRPDEAIRPIPEIFHLP